MKNKVRMQVWVICAGLVGALALLGLYSSRKMAPVKTPVQSVQKASNNSVYAEETSVVVKSVAVSNDVAQETEAALNLVGYSAKTTIPVKVTIVDGNLKK